MSSQVSIIKCADYDEEAVEDAIRNSLELIGGIGQVVTPGDTVLLKVNLLSPSTPDEAVTTHPSVVKAMIRLVVESGGQPVVADAPGYMFAVGEGEALRKSGIMAVAEAMGVRAIQFENVDNPFVKVAVPDAAWIHEIMASRLALEADVIINLPKLKTHSQTWYTGAVKNMFGCVDSATRKKAHNLGEYSRFSGALVDIYSALKPQLAIMDAVVGMEGEGPQQGKPKQTGLILASQDSVAIDAVAAAIVGFGSSEILAVMKASGRGLGSGDLDQIEVLGERIDDVAVDYEKPSGRMIGVHPLLLKLAGRYIKVLPHVREDNCTQCEICAESCPADAITMGPYPVIDRETCIECFCCSEMCPESAMVVRKSLLARLLTR
ncbi:MAG: DUF362 domain-containing protein [Thermoleophilia bacterium]